MASSWLPGGRVGVAWHGTSMPVLPVPWLWGTTSTGCEPPPWWELEWQHCHSLAARIRTYQNNRAKSGMHFSSMLSLKPGHATPRKNLISSTGRDRTIYAVSWLCPSLQTLPRSCLSARRLHSFSWWQNREKPLLHFRSEFALIVIIPDRQK